MANQGMQDMLDGTVGTTIQLAKDITRNLGEQARSAMADPGAMAQELARRAREQALTASNTLSERGVRASEYLNRNINEYPLAALLIAGAVGYGLAYMIHSQWQSSSRRAGKPRGLALFRSPWV